jgi:Domain of unknown function (DUF6894)
MPRYTFQIRNNLYSRPALSSSCLDNDAAIGEATAMFADMARGIADGLGSNPEWQIEVADETGKPIFRLGVLAESLK